MKNEELEEIDLNDPDVIEAAVQIQKSFRKHFKKKEEIVNKSGTYSIQKQGRFKDVGSCLKLYEYPILLSISSSHSI